MAEAAGCVAVAARQVRLNNLQATDVPTISKVQLPPPPPAPASRRGEA